MLLDNNSTLQIIPYQQFSLSTDSQEMTLPSKLVNNYKRVYQQGNFYFKERKRPQTANSNKKPINIQQYSFVDNYLKLKENLHTCPSSQMKKQTTRKKQQGMLRSMTQSTDKETPITIRKRIKSQMDNYKLQQKSIFDRRQFINLILVDDEKKKKKPSSSYGRVIESKNQVQSHQEQLVHREYVNLCKKSRSPYGVPPNQLISSFPFLTLNDPTVNQQILKGFSIDLNDYGTLVSFQQFQQFYDVFIWKRKSLKLLTNLILEFFSDRNRKGLIGLMALNLIDLVQPGNTLQIQAPSYYLQQINRQKNSIKKKLIQKRIVQGEKEVIDLERLKSVLSEQEIHPYRFYHYLSGNKKS